jgi:heme exporter protein B
MLSQFFTLLKKDFQLDLRQRFALGGIILYVFAAVFIIYLAFREISSQTWVILYWIVFLFAAVNAVLKSFSHEGAKRNIYYYTLADPLAVISSKILYNFLVLLGIAVLTGCLFSLFTSFPVLSVGYFVLAVILGCIGIAANFSFISSIAYKTRNQSTMMMVLSFPVVIPLLLPVIQVSVKTLEVTSWSRLQGDFYLLIATDLIILALAYIIWPFLWRE